MAMVKELRPERSADPALYVYVGESFEESGDLGVATRWFTMGLLRCARDED